MSSSIPTHLRSLAAALFGAAVAACGGATPSGSAVKRGAGPR